MVAYTSQIQGQGKANSINSGLFSLQLLFKAMRIDEIMKGRS